MSYATFDHAGWAADNVRAGKARYLSAKRRKPRADVQKGYGAAPDELTPLQRKVFDILGIVGGGIYNAPIAWDAIQWKSWAHGFAVPWRNDLCTFDGPSLTLLVLLCHEARIRCEVRPHGFRHLLLCFWQRSRDGGIGSRHPNIDEAVAQFRNYVPAEHAIIYRDKEAA